jgi:hypothetical protein
MSPDELSNLARALGRLRPAPPSLERDVIMYRAGLRAARRGPGWQIAAGAAAGLALLFAGLWLSDRKQSLPAQIVYMPAPHEEEPPPLPHEEKPIEHEPPPGPPQPPPPIEAQPVARLPEPEPPTDRRKVEEHLLRWGLDGLSPPPPKATPARTVKVEELLRSF